MRCSLAERADLAASPGARRSRRPDPRPPALGRRSPHRRARPPQGSPARGPRDGDARLALAELYRELIAPDQAGRWGIGVPGWTTEVERDRLARMIAHSGIGDHEIPAFLALPPDAALPEELAALAPAIADHRAHFADPARMTRRERKAARYRLPGPHRHVVEDMARSCRLRWRRRD
ncbi:hypothetical protein [Clavibacter zhangzhiyongii]|uniref:hypothetical protein n=1 Tax=Clavibacter zhangzhiyongii TaxID=2768071 RepID=UPI0039DF5C6C